MAGKHFAKSIKVSTGFGLSSKSPLDARTVATTVDEMNSIPDIQLYEGLEVYVEANKTKYQYTGTTFIPLSIAAVIDNLTSTSTTVGLSANQGRVLKGLLDDHIANKNAAGSKHIPAGGSTGQKLMWSAAGVAKWVNDTIATAASQPFTFSGPLTAVNVVINPDIALPGSPTTTTAPTADNSTKIATTGYVNALVNSKLAAADAMTYKGSLDGSIANQKLPAANAGDTYKVSKAGTISTLQVHIGDILICKQDNTSADTKANWDLVCNNEDGKVIGPAASVTNNIAVFNGTTGKLIKDSGVTIASLVPRTFQVVAGSGLTGGGTLSGNVTLNIGQGAGIVVGVDSIAHQPKQTIMSEEYRMGAGQFVKIVEVDQFGHIVAVTGGNETQLSCPTGAAEAGKYVSAIGVSGHLITVTKTSLPAETGRVRVTSSDALDYLQNKIIPLAAASLGTNEYAVKTTLVGNKIALSVVIDRIDGGYYDA